MSALDSIIKQKRAEAETSDEGFSGTVAVGLDGETTEAKPAAKRKSAEAKKKKPTGDKATDAVKRAMSVLEIEQEGETSVGSAPMASKAQVFGGDRLDPIARPNGQSYRPRILTDKTDVETLRACRDAEIPVLLGGFPGCGKTAMIEAAFGDDLVTIEGHGDMEVTDLVGTWVAQTNGTYAWVDGPLVVAMKEGRVLFVDDCTLIPAPVLARLYPSMDGRKTVRVTEHEGETINAADGFFVVGAHNPGAPGAILSEALASRFLVQIDVESDLNLATSMGVDRRIVKAAKNLRERRDKGTSTWAPEMRELLGFARVSKALGMDVAAANMVSVAPEDARDAVIEALGTAFPGLEPLRLGDA
jgi:MoxR-like ATPase